MLTEQKFIYAISVFFTIFGLVYFVLSLFNGGFGMVTGLLAMILGELVVS